MIHVLEGKSQTGEMEEMRDVAQQPVRQADEQKKVPRERPSLPTPSQFYKEIVAREDIRAILKRLANN